MSFFKKLLYWNVSINVDWQLEQKMNFLITQVLQRHIVYARYFYTCTWEWINTWQARIVEVSICRILANFCELTLEKCKVLICESHGSEKYIKMIWPAVTQNWQNKWLLVWTRWVFEPAHEKRVLITKVTSEDSGEPVHPRSLARAFAVRSHNIWD